ncbi:hypothetical protein DV451_001345 [Geotrichum candidum]|uniref:Uncharacterized protein n=1 Tax=Geotrichum candidum TaxID=1173061 RepID=A0A9P5G6X8_GEOCN|nr:hypothetical protein DV451_001345 [Geotrichum candidum]
MASTQNLPGQPPWRNSSLPFMVIVDTTTSAGPALPPAPRSQHEPTTSSINNNNNNSSSSHDTPVPPPPPPPPPPPEEEWETIYPDVRYIFSDDQFFPTVEVLNSQTTTTASAADDNDPDAAAAAAADTIPSGTVVVDFDQTGQKIVDINSLAVDWQVADVSLGAAATATAAVTKSPAARPSAEPDTGSPRRTTATATQQLPPPPWAEEAMQSDSVAHVLRIRGVRPARPLPPYYYSSSAATPTAGAASVGRAAVASPAALVAAFRRTNAQIRQILDLTMTADATTPASTAPDSRPASPPTPQTD